MKDFLKSPVFWLGGVKNKKENKTELLTVAKQLEVLERTDRLAMQRTLLANERTLLAYVRTSVSLVLLGVALIQFFTHQASLVLGIFFVALGIGFLVYGFRSHLIRQSTIASS
jgi:putative membrane protein